MRNLRQLAFDMTMNHLVISGILGLVVLYVSFERGIGGAAHERIWWFALMDDMFLILEAPVVLILWLVYHPQAGFDPPHHYAIDFVFGSRFIVAAGLCIIWSIVFGCGVSYVVFRVKRSKPTASEPSGLSQ